MVNGVLIEEIGRDNSFDDLLLNFPAEILSADRLRMLSGNNNGVDPERDDSASVMLVLDSDLSLGIRAQPRQGARTTSDSHRSVEFVSQHDSQGHVLLGLVSGVAKHDPLIASAVVLKRAMIQSLGNVWRLLLNGHENVAGLVVEALLRVIVANILDSLANNGLVINPCLGSDFAKDHDHSGLGCGLTCDL